MTQLTNSTDLPLPIAIFLANDSYDYDPNVISATQIIKPIRQLVLGSRVDLSTTATDILTFYKRRLGDAVHNEVERSLIENHSEVMKLLGYPDRVIDRVVLNPSSEKLNSSNGIIPIFTEQRFHKKLNFLQNPELTISGKPDLIVDGNLYDIKTTGTYTYIKNNNFKEYQLQGSIYRWLRPDLIKNDFLTIIFMFTDWNANEFYKDNYPPQPITTKIIPLLSLVETNNYLIKKVTDYFNYLEKEDSTIPECTPEELWMDEPVFKYWKDPTKVTGRSTKNFKNKAEAMQRYIKDGSVGVVKTVHGKAKACNYCMASTICEQRNRLIESDQLHIPNK